MKNKTSSACKASTVNISKQYRCSSWNSSEHFTKQCVTSRETVFIVTVNSAGISSDAFSHLTAILSTHNHLRMLVAFLWNWQQILEGQLYSSHTHSAFPAFINAILL